jgi:uncharacterized protein
VEIRSITLFDNLTNPIQSSSLARARQFQKAATALADRVGIHVQTLRLATQPFARWLPLGDRFAAACRDAERALLDTGIRYFSFGTFMGDAPDSDPSVLDCLPEAVSETSDVSFSVTIASARHGVSLSAIRAAAKAISEIAATLPDGMGNLRFAALANCAPHTPFFPVAYHDGGRPQFSIALEGAGLAVEAFGPAISSDDASERLFRSAGVATKQAVEFARLLAKETHVGFRGIDLSTTSGEGREHSFGGAVERLGVSRFGDSGTLYAIALTTSTIDAVRFPRAGFCGAMLPVMEDAVLAQRAAEGVFGIGDLLQYSSVCGTGLDTIPLPGDISTAELASILMDVAALSVRLAKPLTARLMPMPGKKAGDMTSVSSPYLVNTRVMAARGAIGGKLSPT